MGKEKTKSLLDDVVSRAVGKKRGFRTWFDRLPPEAQAELAVVKANFDHSKWEKNAYANAIMESCRERGWYTSGRQGVIDWLERP